jgi:hypothetical protein
MIVRVELLAGANKKEPTKMDIDKNIAALERAINGKPLSNDSTLLIDTKSIMEAIRKELPSFHC